MKNKKTIEAYLTQKERPLLDAIFIGMTAVGVVLIALWTFFYVGIGFFGLPLSIIGGAATIILRSSRVTDEDFDGEVKRILTVKGIEENDSTLKEYIVGKNEYVKRGNDKKIRTAFYCVTVFDFKRDSCCVKKHVIDLLDETVSVSQTTVPLGCGHMITEKTCRTAIGDVNVYYLSLNDQPEIAIPVNMNVYDTEAVINRVTHKR